MEVREVNRILGEVLSLQGVDCGQPDDAAPREVESEMVVADVDGAEVPVFVDEEVEYVDCVESGGDDDGVGDKAMDLILVGYKRKITNTASAKVMKRDGRSCDRSLEVKGKDQYLH